MVLHGATVRAALPLLRCGTPNRPPVKEVEESKKKKGQAAAVVGGRGFGRIKADVKWQCARGCGACCKLDKGPAFPTPEEIFSEDPSHLELYKSMIGPDGWCINYEPATRTCSIYPDRPFFCRVEPAVFQELFGISRRRFNQEACSFCKDTITDIYGSASDELKNFNTTVTNTE